MEVLRPVPVTAAVHPIRSAHRVGRPQRLTRMQSGMVPVEQQQDCMLSASTRPSFAGHHCLTLSWLNLSQRVLVMFDTANASFGALEQIVHLRLHVILH